MPHIQNQLTGCCRHMQRFHTGSIKATSTTLVEVSGAVRRRASVNFLSVSAVLVESTSAVVGVFGTQKLIRAYCSYCYDYAGVSLCSREIETAPASCFSDCMGNHRSDPGFRSRPRSVGRYFYCGAVVGTRRFPNAVSSTTSSMSS